MQSHSKIALLFFSLLVAFCVYTAPSYAQGSGCIAGLPCVTPMTPNIPWDNSIAPNNSGANAAKSDSDTCDADFMNQIYARSVLHAEREYGMLQTILRKPDSVLEYSCFETHLDMAAERVPRIFSETTRFSSEYFDDSAQDGDGWGSAVSGALSTFGIGAAQCEGDDAEAGEFFKIGLDCIRDDQHEPEADDNIDNDPINSDLDINVYMSSNISDDETRLGNLLENLILRGLVEAGGGGADTNGKYIDSNFYHPYLGGGMLVDTPATNNSFDGEIELKKNYTCLAMNSVWQFAKCRDFAIDDQMLDFDLVSSAIDPRLFPKTCDPYDPLIDATLLPLASNEANAFVHFDSSYLTHDATGFYPHIRPNVNLNKTDIDGAMRYGHFTKVSECLQPVRTGIIVTTEISVKDPSDIINVTQETHTEHVCINAGCYYDKEQDRCLP